MNYLVLAGIILFSSLIAYQDFKSRSISVLYLLGFTLVAFSYGVIQFQLKQTLLYFSFNLLFIAFQASVLLLYYYIKYRNFKSLLGSIGGADIWVIISLAFSFDLQRFIIFMSLSLIASLLFYSVINNITDRKIKEIPLAGILVVCCSVFLTLKLAGLF
ncbi:MAG: hypothetical protein Q8M29_01210 [Bacteroidota bacterium]|nr:hypothetical protein [Bacteroidota bacterium]